MFPTIFFKKFPPSAAAKGASSGAVGLSAAISPGPPPSSGPLGGFEVMKKSLPGPNPPGRSFGEFFLFLCWKIFWMFFGFCDFFWY